MNPNMRTFITVYAPFLLHFRPLSPPFDRRAAGSRTAHGKAKPPKDIPGRFVSI